LPFSGFVSVLFLSTAGNNGAVLKWITLLYQLERLLFLAYGDGDGGRAVSVLGDDGLHQPVSV
jgi:hypothetical protein